MVISPRGWGLLRSAWLLAGLLAALALSACSFEDWGGVFYRALENRQCHEEQGSHLGCPEAMRP